jgi:hypothetical protein
METYWGVSLPAGTLGIDNDLEIVLEILKLVFGDIAKICFCHSSWRNTTDFGTFFFLDFLM